MPTRRVRTAPRTASSPAAEDGGPWRVIAICVPMRWSDMDAYGHVNNATFFTYLEEARVDMLFVNAGERGRDASSCRLASSSRATRSTTRRRWCFARSPVPIDVWVIATWARRRSRAALRDPRRRRPGLRRAATVLVPYDVEAGRPRRVSDEERAALEAFLEPP